MTFSLVLIGPPGSGKGTQARAVCDSTGALYVGTGDMLRSMSEGHGAEAERVRARLDTGELFSDEEVGQLVARRISPALDDGRSIVFDGYPRRFEQGMVLDRLVRDHSAPFAIQLDVSDEQCQRRLAARRICLSCKRPALADISLCRSCGGRLTRRGDDLAKQAVVRRLEEYHAVTAPVLEYYSTSGRLYAVDGQEEPSRITAAILRICSG